MRDAPESSRPTHVEGYPRLDLRQARKHVLNGRTMVIWRERDTLVGVGHAEIVEDGLTLRSRFRVLTYLSHHRQEHHFTCELIERTRGQTDVLTACPLCGNSKRVLVFSEDEWTCQDCQYLSYRASRVSRRVKDTLRLSELESLVGAGRPKSMRQDRYFYLRDELSSLREEVGDRPATVSADLLPGVTAWWSDEPPAAIGPDAQLLDF